MPSPKKLWVSNWLSMLDSSLYKVSTTVQNGDFCKSSRETITTEEQNKQPPLSQSYKPVDEIH